MNVTHFLLRGLYDTEVLWFTSLLFDGRLEVLDGPERVVMTSRGSLFLPMSPHPDERAVTGEFQRMPYPLWDNYGLRT